MAGGVSDRERGAVGHVDVDSGDVADRGSRAVDDVSDDEDPSVGSGANGQVGAEEQLTVVDATGNGVDDRLRALGFRSEGALVGGLVRPGCVDRVERRRVEQDRGQPVGQEFDVDHGACRGRRAVGIGDRGVGGGERHASVRSFEM